MDLVIDEDVPPPVRALLEARGHTVVLDLKEGLKGTKDEQIAITASQHRVVVVTFNYTHFAALLRKYPKMGVIGLKCSHPAAIGRLTTMLPIIEAYFAMREATGETFHVELGPAAVRMLEPQKGRQ